MLVRLEYSVGSQVRFLSHLDYLRLFARALRRAGLPVAYSQGFNPHPKLAFGPPLPVGVTSSAEYLDLELAEPVPLPGLMMQLGQALPEGIRVKEAREIKGKVPALMAVIERARYRVTVPLPEMGPDLPWPETVARLLARPSIVISRRTKAGERLQEIRPGIFSLAAAPGEGAVVFTMDLQIGSRGAVRPEEVVQALRELEGVPVTGTVRIHRQGLFALKGQRLVTPLEIL